MSIRPLIWAADFVPDLSLNMDITPSWSPEIYDAVLWDHNVNFSASFKASLKAELGEYTYFQINFESTLVRLTLGLQNFVMEDIPSHYCVMGYSDVDLMTVSVGFEANTKNCKKNFVSPWTFHFGNDQPEPVPVKNTDKTPVVDPIKPDVNPNKPNPKPIKPIIKPVDTGVKPSDPVV
jgi:hypothetical protein